MAYPTSPGGCGRRKVTVLATVGEITYSRQYVTGPDGKRSFPLDIAMGVVAGCTPAMASLLSRAGAMNQSYDGAGENASKMMGVHVEGRRIHRVVEAVSDEELKWIAERPVESCPKGGNNNRFVLGERPREADSPEHQRIVNTRTS